MRLTSMTRHSVKSKSVMRLYNSKLDKIEVTELDNISLTNDREKEKPSEQMQYKMLTKKSNSMRPARLL